MLSLSRNLKKSTRDLFEMDSKLKLDIEKRLDAFYSTKRPHGRSNNFRYQGLDKIEKWKLQSRQDLISHCHWPILSLILSERSSFQVEVLNEKEFYPPPHTTNTLYIGQLKTLAEEYEYKVTLLENWYKAQDPAQLEIPLPGIRNLLLLPLNILFRRRLEVVHHYAMRVKSMPMEPLKNCINS